MKLKRILFEGTGKKLWALSFRDTNNELIITQTVSTKTSLIFKIVGKAGQDAIPTDSANEKELIKAIQSNLDHIFKGIFYYTKKNKKPHQYEFEVDFNKASELIY